MTWCTLIEVRNFLIDRKKKFSMRRASRFATPRADPGRRRLERQDSTKPEGTYKLRVHGHEFNNGEELVLNVESFPYIQVRG